MNLEHPHAMLAKVAWEAVSVGDADALSEICSEDVVWHASGRGKLSGVYRGQTAVFGYLASVGEEAERFDSTLEDILVGSRFISVLMTVSGTRGDRELDTNYVLIFRVEDAHIAEIWAVPREQHVVEAFWA
jgi:ketosteroid isomerase-like protein